MTDLSFLAAAAKEIAQEPPHDFEAWMRRWTQMVPTSSASYVEGHLRTCEAVLSRRGLSREFFENHCCDMFIALSHAFDATGDLPVREVIIRETDRWVDSKNYCHQYTKFRDEAAQMKRRLLEQRQEHRRELEAEEAERQRLARELAEAERQRHQREEAARIERERQIELARLAEIRRRKAFDLATEKLIADIIDGARRQSVTVKFEHEDFKFSMQIVGPIHPANALIGAVDQISRHDGGQEVAIKMLARAEDLL